MTLYVKVARRKIEHVCVCSIAQSCPALCGPMETVVHQAPLSMEFFRQEYCSWLPFPPPGNLPDPGIEPESFVSPVLVGRLFTNAPPGMVLTGD